ncbi:MAG: hypothetical protein HN979_04610 [Actinobacteria bacterium]|jgi:hypothetical protein|nr:hypothetical protein [Actinomycetota bacterium]MBT3687488.1 hypothetical protein [Actinomycetota bacterium]MBT4038216.1 hypothetical protein [Actinomycetota bacterium]MBT4344288.1 hypothetical protein [Actinomycetota bacterium]MBT4786799.1 hypothetical protein [Actinomycetota bacterium]
MDALTAARHTATPIGDLGARFMLDGLAYKRGAELGLPSGMGTYVLGRLGVMGDVDLDAAVAAAFFWNPDTIATNWSADDSAVTPSAAAPLYGQVCVERGRVYLAGFEGAARLAELLERVVDSADDTDADLFAGWRDLERPTDPEGRAYLLTQVARELRFCRHVTVVQAAGANPLALVLTKGGEANANLFGWNDLSCGPLDPEAHASIEAATDQAAAADLQCLTSDERAELVELASAALAHGTA